MARYTTSRSVPVSRWIAEKAAEPDAPAAEGYAAMDERRAVKTLLTP